MTSVRDRRSQVLLGSVGATIVILVLVVVLTLASVGSNSTSQSADAAPSGAPVAVPDPIREKFALFSRARRAGDVVGGVPQALDAFSEQKINPGLARRAAALGENVWVVPGHDRLCLLYLPEEAQGVGGSCSSVEDTYNGLLTALVGTGANTAVYGVVPDGVSAVRVALLGGGSVALPVRENVYAATVGRPTEAISFDSPDGPRTILARSLVE